MSTNRIWQEIREALEGRPGQPIVLGVCRTLGDRLGWETWRVRLVFLVLGVIWTLPTLAAYIVAGFVLHETERRTRDFFTGLAVVARESAARVTDTLGRLFDPGARHDARPRG